MWEGVGFHLEEPLHFLIESCGRQQDLPFTRRYLLGVPNVFGGLLQSFMDIYVRLRTSVSDGISSVSGGIYVLVNNAEVSGGASLPLLLLPSHNSCGCCILMDDITTYPRNHPPATI